MRGKRLYPRETGRAQRITPADAGKTFLFLLRITIIWDHPRGCGENLTDRKNAAERLGSPPRMRGKRNPTYEDFGEDRITPADAGKT